MDEFNLQEEMEKFAAPIAKTFSVLARELNSAEREDARAEYVEEIMRLLIEKESDPSLAEKLKAAKEAIAAQSVEPIRFSSDNPPPGVVAKRLREAAEKRGVTQREIAEKLGVTPAVISRVFRNPDRSRLQTLRKIADAIGVELKDIV